MAAHNAAGETTNGTTQPVPEQAAGKQRGGASRRSRKKGKSGPWTVDQEAKLRSTAVALAEQGAFSLTIILMRWTTAGTCRQLCKCLSEKWQHIAQRLIASGLKSNESN